jgi:hypothetical protein
MVMQYEEAVKIWAAKKWNLDMNKVKRVEIGHRESYGGGCDTCGYGADECSFEIEIFMTNKTKAYPHGWMIYELPTTGLNDLLKEILESTE